MFMQASHWEKRKSLNHPRRLRKKPLPPDALGHAPVQKLCSSLLGQSFTVLMCPPIMLRSWSLESCWASPEDSSVTFSSKLQSSVLAEEQHWPSVGAVSLRRPTQPSTMLTCASVFSLSGKGSTTFSSV